MTGHGVSVVGVTDTPAQSRARWPSALGARAVVLAEGSVGIGFVTVVKAQPETDETDSVEALAGLHLFPEYHGQLRARWAAL